MKKNVCALLYPLFCLLGHALRRLWDPKPQLTSNVFTNAILATLMMPSERRQAMNISIFMSKETLSFDPSFISDVKQLLTRL